MIHLVSVPTTHARQHRRMTCRGKYIREINSGIVAVSLCALSPDHTFQSGLKAIENVSGNDTFRDTAIVATSLVTYLILLPTTYC